MICRLFRQGLARARCVAALASALVLAGASAPAQEMMPPAPASAQQRPSDPVEGIDALKSAFVEIDGKYKEYKESANAEDALAALKGQLAPLRDELSDRRNKLEPRLKAIEQRTAELPAPPAAGATEEPAIAADRHRLAARLGEVETALQQVKSLAEQADGLDERIRRQRREVFSRRLFARSASLFDPSFWTELSKSIPAEVEGLRVMLSSWGAYARANGGGVGAVSAGALLLALAIAAWFLAQWRRRLSGGPTPRNFDKALAAAVRMAYGTVKLPALITATIWVLHTFGLMPDSVWETGRALALATLVTGFGRGVAVGLFAAGEPDRRIVALTDQEAASYASHLTWAARITGLAILANEVHRILGQPVTPFVATSELQAFALLAIIVHMLWRTARFSAQDEGAGGARGWLRVILWLCSMTIAVSLASGYVGFSVFVAVRVVGFFAVGGAVFLLITIIDAALTDLLAPATPGGRHVAAAFGLTSRGLDLITTLASALQRIVVAVLAVILALNVSGVFTDDIYSAMEHIISDYDVGAIHVSPVAILSAVACIIVGGLSVRAAQRWLAVKFLPRTGLEAGLQNSIVALSGYFALIVVLAVALGIVGIDLQKIALIAGALSVGIGFGLQSIVSNFVSGLILLAERSVRVGDWVVVKNEEGYVRRISIRATEIETFDRASVIIPNQEFITGSVKNWTHSNTLGRAVVKVRVAFDSDVMRVRELMLEAAVKHPQVLQGTPSVFIMGFGDIGIDFELMCVIANVGQGLTVRTELYMDILGKFRDARIKIPHPPHETTVPAVPAQAPPAPKIA